MSSDFCKCPVKSCSYSIKCPAKSLKCPVRLKTISRTLSVTGVSGNGKDLHRRQLNIQNACTPLSCLHLKSWSLLAGSSKYRQISKKQLGCLLKVNPGKETTTALTLTTLVPIPCMVGTGSAFEPCFWLIIPEVRGISKNPVFLPDNFHSLLDA